MSFRPMPSHRAPGPEVRLYVPTELHAELKQLAETHERPITREVLLAIRERVAAHRPARQRAGSQNENGPA